MNQRALSKSYVSLVGVNIICEGSGGGLAVSVLASYSNNPSSIPALGAYFVRKTKINEKEAGVGPSFIKKYSRCFRFDIFCSFPFNK